MTNIMVKALRYTHQIKKTVKQGLKTGCVHIFNSTNYLFGRAPAGRTIRFNAFLRFCFILYFWCL